MAGILRLGTAGSHILGRRTTCYTGQGKPERKYRIKNTNIDIKPIRCQLENTQARMPIYILM